jgi:hypothetical protein
MQAAATISSRKEPLPEDFGEAPDWTSDLGAGDHRLRTAGEKLRDTQVTTIVRAAIGLSSLAP